MDLLICIKLVWLQKVSNRGMPLTMKIFSVLLLKLLLLDLLYPLLCSEAEILDSWMFRMCFFMMFWSRRYI
jgi:hypothetical protein